MDRISSGIQENQFQLKPYSYEVKSSIRVMSCTGCYFQMFSCENVDGSNFNCGIQVN